MMQYSDIEIPPRSNHLWRYTQWKRIHPTAVSEVPSANEIRFSDGEEVSMKGSDEIARSFIHQSSNISRKLSLNDDEMTLDIRCGGHICAGELNIVSKGNSSLIITISGDPGWVGLRVVGEVEGSLSIALINNLAGDAHFLRCEDWDVGRDSTLEFATLSSGGFLVKSDIRVDLSAPGSETRGGIATYGHDSRHDDHHVEIAHSVGNTQSSLVMHAACGDSSHSVGTGLLTIAEGANASDAGQVFRNLLLSEKARADAIPELEVLADDVKAAHGSASSPIDLKQLHYLASRGLSPSQAEAMIVEGFLMDAFREMKNQSIIDSLRTRLLVHLECLING